MSDKLLNILKEHSDISEQKLMDYLMGHLTPEERHEVEMHLTDTELLADAEEGLSQLKNKEKINQTVALLNKKLTEKLKERRKRKSNWQKPNQSLLIVTTFIILTLVVIAFLVIMKMRTE